MAEGVAGSSQLGAIERGYELKMKTQKYSKSQLHISAALTLTSILGGSGLLSGCAQTPAISPTPVPTPKPVPPPTKKATPKPTPISSNNLHEMAEDKDANEIYKQAFNALLRRQFDTLEVMADKYRKSKAHYSTGEWKLTYFYDCTRAIELPQYTESTMMVLREWVKTKPDSITARMALARGLVRYAMFARGGGTGDTVTSEGGRLMRERLAESWTVLQDARKLDEKCPEWWAIAMSIAQGQGWKKKDYDKLYQEAIAFEPQFYPYHFQKTVYLLARWYGDMGDPEKFATAAADAMARKKGKKAGDVLYARIIWYMDRKRFQELTYFEPVVSAKRVESGFQELARMYPDNLSVANEMARLYAFIDSPKTEPQRRVKAKKLYDKIGKNADKKAFRDDYDLSVHTNWAYGIHPAHD